MVFSLYGLAEIEPHFGFEILLVDFFVRVLDKDDRSDCVARCRVYGGELNVDTLPVLECLLGAYRTSAVVVDDELSPRKVKTGRKGKEGRLGLASQVALNLTICGLNFKKRGLI